MTKKLLTGVIALLLLAALAVPAFAAINDTQKQEINDLYSQIAELRKQLVQKYVDAGELTKEQGETAKKNIDRATKYQEENGGTPGLGYGCGGAGYGMMNGAGYGMMGGAGYGMMGGYNTAAGQSI